MTASGDGAGESRSEKGVAGWGGVIYAAQTSQRDSPHIQLVAGPVITTPGVEGYKGAKAATNNAAELLALEAMAKAVEETAAHGEWAEIHTDSRLALLAALGVRPKSRRKPKRRASDKRGGAPPNEVLVNRAREAFQRAKAALGHRLALRKIKGHSGDVWNEVADALAAVGRTLATGRTPDTAEVIDRMQRAIYGERLDEPPTIASRGFRLA